MLTETEVEANRNAHESRVAILANLPGRRFVRGMLRMLQALRLYPRT